MIPNYKRPQINEYIFDILERPMTDEDLEMINYLQEIEKENKELKKQLEYLRSGEYYNQLRFERDMLQNVADNSKVSKEDKEFIDMTHRNTELLEQQKEFIKYLEDEIERKRINATCTTEYNDYVIPLRVVLQKYKEIIKTI